MNYYFNCRQYKKVLHITWKMLLRILISMTNMLDVWIFKQIGQDIWTLITYCQFLAIKCAKGRASWFGRQWTYCANFLKKLHPTRKILICCDYSLLTLLVAISLVVCVLFFTIFTISFQLSKPLRTTRTRESIVIFPKVWNQIPFTRIP